jgi:hypothetical protein
VIDIATRRGPFHDHLVFFATPQEVDEIAARCRPHDVFRFPHTVGTTTSPRVRLLNASHTNCVDLRQDDDALLAAMDAKSCRYEIRRASKLGDRLEARCNEPSARDDFLALYNAFVQWKGYAPPMTERRLQEYLAASDVFVAYVDDVPLVGHLLVRDPSVGRVRLVFSASSRFAEGPHQKLSGPVNRWLHWHEIRHYRSEGYDTFDFGGGIAGPIGRFKVSFGGNQEDGCILVVEGALARNAVRAFETLRRWRTRRAA